MSSPMTQKPVVVAFELAGESLAAFESGLGGAAPVVLLTEQPDTQRLELLCNASAVFIRNTTSDFLQGELEALGNARLVQCFSAGVDFIDFGGVPEYVPIACNAGAFAQPMAEHAVAMTLAAYKRLFVEHRHLMTGTFNQFVNNKQIAGSTFGVIGFGGIGVASARLMRALGARVIAINRRGKSHEPVDFVGTQADLAYVLHRSDAVLLSAPYTRETEKMIGAQELAQMKPDAVLVNLARGELIDEVALYEHLLARPEFTACIDAWWVEPVRHGHFRMNRPFLDLPNVIGSPHNSASVRRVGAPPYRLAGENCRRAVLGEPILHLVDRALIPGGSPQA